jgi:thymidylate synthase
VKNLKTGIMQNKHTHEDGTPFTEEEFLLKLKTDKEFNNEFGNKGVDQISELIKQLKDNPDSRRLLVSAWAVHDLPNMTLPPCHYGFQVYTRELSREERIQIYVNQYMGGVGKPAGFEDAKLTTRDIPTRAISLMWNQRSCDFPLGIPYNIASYAILLEIIGKMVNMVPDELIGNLGDCHIYSNQVEGCKEQITREPYKLPKLVISNQVNFNEGIDELLNSCLITDFKIDGYQSHPTIKFPLSN